MLVIFYVFVAILGSVAPGTALPYPSVGTALRRGELGTDSALVVAISQGNGVSLWKINKNRFLRMLLIVTVLVPGADKARPEQNFM